MKGFVDSILKTLIYIIAAIIFLCLIGGGIIPGLIYNSYRKNREKKERLEKERAMEREKFIKDSLANDPFYQDSLNKERKRWEKEMARRDSIYKNRRLVLISNKDSLRLYHDATFCEDIDILKGPYKVTTIAAAEAAGFTICPSCMDCEIIYDEYKSGDLIDREEHEAQIEELEEMYCRDYYDEE